MISLNYYDGSLWNSFGTVTSLSTGTGLDGGPITTSGTISLANTSIFPGIYTYPSFTVDAQGRLVAASSGSTPVTSVGITGSSGLTVAGSPITSSGTIALGLSSVPISVLSGYPGSSSTFLRGDGSWVVPTSGVTSVLGTANQITVTGTTTPVISLPLNVTIQGVLTAGSITSTSSTTSTFAGNVTLGATKRLNADYVAANTYSYAPQFSHPSGDTGSPKIGGTAAVILASGTTAQRPALAVGMLRYNTSSAVFEGLCNVSDGFQDILTRNTKDAFQVLLAPYIPAWDAALGNVGYILLTKYSNFIVNIYPRKEATLILFVQQDSTGNRSLYINGIYRLNSSNVQMDINPAANSVTCLVFKNDYINSRLYLQSVTYGYQKVPDISTSKTIYYGGNETTVTVIPSANMLCRIRLLGGGGGQGIYQAGSGSSGAGGYTEYAFSTTNYISDTFIVYVGKGGGGGSVNSSGTAYGGRNGGNDVLRYAIAGDTAPGGGGDSSIAYFSPTLKLAVAGGGGGGSGYGLNYLGAGGGTTGQSGDYPGSGGTQTAGGASPSSTASPQTTRPANFVSAIAGLGAGVTSNLMIGSAYDCGGGGNGYYGGGCAGGDGKTSGGGSGYVNKAFSAYTYGETYAGSGAAIPSQASTIYDFVGYGYGRSGAARPSAGTTLIGLDGCDGLAIVEFL